MTTGTITPGPQNPRAKSPEKCPAATLVLVHSHLNNTREDDDDPGLDVTRGDWDSDMLCYPHAFECRGKVYLLYNGNEFGRYGFGLAVLE